MFYDNNLGSPYTLHTRETHVTNGARFLTTIFSILVALFFLGPERKVEV